MSVSTEVHILSPVYFLLFLVLVGFIYHLIRNEEYKDTLLASIIIGLIFGLLLDNNPDLIIKLINVLLFIIMVIIGGLISVSLKKMTNNTTKKQHDTSNQDSGKIHELNKQKTKYIAIILICILSLILFSGFLSLSNPIRDPVQDPVQLLISIHTTNGTELEGPLGYNEDTIIRILIPTNTTKFTLNGSSEANATVKITTKELGIYNQTVHLDPDNTFAYTISIPQNVSFINVTIEAIKPGKESSIRIISLKRKTD